jgi:hypothetical protein
MTPKEYKQMMDYLTRSGIKDKVKFASDIGKPVDKFEVQQIKLFNEFNRRNPKAGGGMLVQPRNMYAYAGIVKQGPNKGKHKYTDFYPKKTKGSFHEWFDSKKEMNEALQKRKEESGRGLTEKELTKKHKKELTKRGYKTWGEAPDKVKRSISTQTTPSALARKEELPRFKKEGLSKRLNEKTRKLLKTKKPINPKTGLPYTVKEYTDDLTAGQKMRLNLAMQGKKRKDVGSFYVPGSKKKGFYPEKDANRLINYMKIAADQQKNLPIKERTFINVFDDKDKEKFIGVRDVKQNTLYTHVDYNLGKPGAKKGTVITKHPDYDELDTFFKVAKKFKYERPEKLLGIYFKDYEKVPTYNEIYKFFTTNRNASVKTFQNNALTIQHQKLIGKVPTQNFQLLTNINNTKAASIMRKYNRGEISKAKADYDLKKIGARQEGLGVLQRDITPEKGLASAKKETIKLFKDAYKVNPKIVEDITQKLKILGGGNCGRGLKNQGGRVDLRDGTSSVDVCVTNAIQRINSGFKNATPAEARNYTKLLNAVKGSAVIGRNLLKFGIIPEALYVGADSLVRMGFGDTFKEAGLRASDFFIPGDQMQEADKLKVQRTLGDAAATNVGRVFDYRNQIANIDSLEQQKANLKNLSDVGEFDYIGDLSQDVKNIDTRLNQAKNDLQNKFMVSEAETVAADKALEEAYDISKAKSPLARLKSFAQNIEAVQDDPFLSDITSPQKTQMELNLNMFPTLPTSVMGLKTSDAINLAQSLRAEGQNVSAKDILAYRDELKQMPLMDAANQFGREQVFGTQGTFFGEPIIKTQPRVRNTSQDIDPFQAAGGGIAKLAGDRSGPPPESGPNSQGLQGLMKRVRNL